MSPQAPVPEEPLSRLSMETPKQHTGQHPFFYVGGVFLNSVVFIVVGPPMGGVILLTVAFGLENSLSGIAAGILAYFVFFFVAVPTSYFIGYPAAAATGAIVAIASIWITSNRSLYTIAAAVGGVASVILLARSEFLMRGSGLVASYISFALSGSIAATVCTRLAFRLGVVPGLNLAHKRAAVR